MIFQPNPTSVLLVSASAKLNQALRDLLPLGEYDPVTGSSGEGEARRLLLEASFDLVLINSPLPDGAGVALAEEICRKSESAVLLLTPAAQFQEVRDRVVRSGVVTLPKPLHRQSFLQALDFLCAMRERLRQREEKQLSLEEKIVSLRLIDRAKWMLVRERAMTEPAAHRWLEQQAMERRISKRQVAEELLRQIEQHGST